MLASQAEPPLPRGAPPPPPAHHQSRGSVSSQESGTMRGGVNPSGMNGDVRRVVSPLFASESSANRSLERFPPPPPGVQPPRTMGAAFSEISADSPEGSLGRRDNMPGAASIGRGPGGDAANDNNSLSGLGRNRFESTNSNDFARPSVAAGGGGGFFPTAHRGLFASGPGGTLKPGGGGGGGGGDGEITQEQFPLRTFGGMGGGNFPDDMDERRTLNSTTGASVISASMQQHHNEPAASQTVSMLYGMLFTCIGCVLIFSKVISGNSISQLYIDIFGLYMFGIGFMSCVYAVIAAASAINAEGSILDSNAGTIYSRIAIGVFFLATLTHNVVIMAENISYDKDCAEMLYVILLVLVILFQIGQLVLVLRYPGACIRSLPGAARVAFAHIIACNCYFWFSRAVQETEQAIAVQLPALHIPFACGVRDTSLPVTRIEETLSPLLLPLTVAFCMYSSLAVYRMWENVERLTAPGARELMEESEPMLKLSSAKEIAAVVFGVVSVVISIITVVLYIILRDEEGSDETPVLYYIMSNMIWVLVLAFLLPVATCAIKRHRKQGFYHNSIDRPILVATSLASLTYAIFSAMSAFIFLLNGIVSAVAVLTVLFYSLETLQIAAQTIYLMDSMRRSPSRSIRPSKSFVVFFLLVNLSLSIFFLFQLHDQSVNPIQVDFYGILNWEIMLNFVAPVACLYRIHSVFCFLDTWKFAY